MTPAEASTLLFVALWAGLVPSAFTTWARAAGSKRRDRGGGFQATATSLSATVLRFPVHTQAQSYGQSAVSPTAANVLYSSQPVWNAPHHVDRRPGLSSATGALVVASAARPETAPKARSFAYLPPQALLAYALLGEALTPSLLLGGGCILGAALVATSGGAAASARGDGEDAPKAA